VLSKVERELVRLAELDTFAFPLLALEQRGSQGVKGTGIGHVESAACERLAELVQ
jgi:hypothetical protein